MVIGAAYEDAATHEPNEKTGTQELRYRQGYMDLVDLVMTPTEETTWEMWRFALLGVGNFMQTWEYVELTFDIVVPGVGRVGVGRVFQIDKAGSDG